MVEMGIAKVAVFEGKHIRKILHEEEWWFSIIDIVQVLTGSSIPKRYWSDLKRKLTKEGYFELYEKIVQFKMSAPDGKMRLTDCANTETLFRIIQSIPSPKVEPLKRWLARIGKERIDEIKNPELSMERMKELITETGSVCREFQKIIWEGTEEIEKISSRSNPVSPVFIKNSVDVSA
jgi:DNA-damage-inducible protein D